MRRAILAAVTAVATAGVVAAGGALSPAPAQADSILNFSNTCANGHHPTGSASIAGSGNVWISDWSAKSQLHRGYMDIVGWWGHKRITLSGTPHGVYFNTNQPGIGPGIGFIGGGYLHANHGPHGPSHHLCDISGTVIVN